MRERRRFFTLAWSIKGQGPFAAFMHPIKHLALVSVSCFSLHHLLHLHHIQACHASFWSIYISDSAYCSFVYATLKALQWAPITLAGPLLSRGSLAPAFRCPSDEDQSESAPRPTTRRSSSK